MDWRIVVIYASYWIEVGHMIVYYRQIRNINESVSSKAVAIQMKIDEHDAKKRFYILWIQDASISVSRYYL